MKCFQGDVSHGNFKVMLVMFGSGDLENKYYYCQLIDLEVAT